MPQSFKEFCAYATDPNNVRSFKRHTLELFIRLMEEGKRAPDKCKFMRELDARIDRVNSVVACVMCQKEIPYIVTEGTCDEHRFCQDCAKEFFICQFGETCVPCSKK
jgi:hypothetical protein